MMERLTRLGGDKRLLLALAALALLAKAVTAAPNPDDGFLSSHIIVSPPYYSDYYELYLPILKPQTTLQLPAMLLSYPWSFLYVSLLNAVFMAAAAWLTYKVALRYLKRNTAAVAGGLTLLFLATHFWISPTRSEAWLLIVWMAVVYLCDTWRLTGGRAYLVAACLLAGVLGLPMHTNASIIYIYLALFALWQRRQLAGRDWAVAVGALAVSGLAGLAILLVPRPEMLFEFLGMISAGRVEWNIIIREFGRWGWFVTKLNFEPLFPLSVFFGVTATAAVVTLRPSWADARDFARRYAGILIVGLAAFIGLGILPSLPNPQYAAYYFPTLGVLAALAYAMRPASGKAAIVCALAAVAVTGALFIGLRMLAGLSIGPLTLAALAYCLLVTALLCAGWLMRNRALVACALIVAILSSFAVSSERYLSYRANAHEYRELARLHEVDVIYAEHRMGWAFTGSPSHRGLDTYSGGLTRVGSGIVVLNRGGFGVRPEDELDLAAIVPPSCAATELEQLNRRVLPFVDALSRSESVVWLVECDAN